MLETDDPRDGVNGNGVGWSDECTSGSSVHPCSSCCASEDARTSRGANTSRSALTLNGENVDGDVPASVSCTVSCTLLFKVEAATKDEYVPANHRVRLHKEKAIL